MKFNENVIYTKFRGRGGGPKTAEQKLRMKERSPPSPADDVIVAGSGETGWGVEKKQNLDKLETFAVGARGEALNKGEGSPQSRG